VTPSSRAPSTSSRRAYNRTFFAKNTRPSAPSSVTASCSFDCREHSYGTLSRLRMSSGYVPHLLSFAQFTPFLQQEHIFSSKANERVRISRKKSHRALFKGLVPALVGVVPAASALDQILHIWQRKANHRRSIQWRTRNFYVHLCAAAIAGIITGTATNPIWAVKTRLQLSA
jgi:hypothetical protein